MLEYPEVVNAAFVSWHGDGKNLSSAQKMNLRHDVAKSLLSRQYAKLKPDLDKKAAAQQEVDMDEWGMILEDISLAEDVSQ